MPKSLFTSSECLALLAVFSDACKEVELLSNIGKQNFPSSSTSTSTGRCTQANPDTLLAELNKIFFQTLLRYEKARSEDYLELPDGTFRKLNDEESTRVKYLEIVSRISATLKNLLCELDESGTFECLERYCQQEQSELDKLATFVGSASAKERDLVKLQNDVQELEKATKEESVAFFSTLEKLKHEFQELREMAKMTIQYKTKEYAAKLLDYQNMQNQRLSILSDEVERVKAVLSQTTRIAEETNSWLCADISTKVNLLDLVPKTDHPDALAKRLASMKKQLEERQALHAQLKEQYETCDAIVLADDREKEAIRLREEYAKRMLLSVIQLQSWWRTMMAVRGIRKRRRRKGRKGGKGKPAATPQPS
ncbi:hypothetical protein EG68_02045 [Paragonimus skrjabini miyazakii]|uniref:Dynein regulatory complex protein 10 n=1 Tax=Paragonimus skrjabini miyazakii TaxID=59628 RepID=A0A8S9Z0K4_9TREM|nr:hypothetical protein EG68_02045 [Paragonimus skrjabini miyazakii]